jgi:hypothetical protein
LAPAISHIPKQEKSINGNTIRLWYAVGPAEQKSYRGYPDFGLHTVVSDEASVPGVTVMN